MVFPKVETEIRRRILLSIWAYSYEFRAHNIVSDAEYDRESYKVDLRIDTPRPDLDFWFRAWFQPHTGIWIHKHPELPRIAELYERHFVK